MRALVLEDFGRMAVAELPAPTPATDEVIIAVTATGICGSDIHGYTGENGRRVIGQVMGHESEGRISGLGEGLRASAFTVGQRVTFNPVVLPEFDLEPYEGREQHSPNKFVIGVRPDFVASFAQLVAVPARNVILLPDSLPEGYGALIEPLAVAVHAVRRVGVESDARVLVVGGGPIGQSIALALQMIGVENVVVSEVDLARRALLAELGVVALDPAIGTLTKAVTHAFGELADITIDAVGLAVTLRGAIDATKAGGSICLVGMGSPSLEFDAYAVSTFERTIVGSFTYTAKDFEDAAAWMSQSPPGAQHLITRKVPLDQAAAAFAGLAANDGTPGKVLVMLQ